MEKSRKERYSKIYKQAKKEIQNSPKKKIFVVLLIFTIIFVCFFFVSDYFYPKITLKSNHTITLDYMQKYKEPGFKATFKGEDKTDEVIVKSNINSKKIGNYKVTYLVDVFGRKRKVTRKVKVRDISKPEIILASDKDIYVCPGKEYKEEKYEAYDNLDKDITDKVKVVKEKNKITYIVKDKAGNSTVVSRNILYKDISKPNINLTSSDYIYTYVNEKYKEPGFEAKDNCDGDLTKSVKVSGNVDNTIPGEYKLIYKVVDSSGNKSKVERTVNVIEAGKDGTIYLTFDDGPREGVTNVILDILKDEGVKATFFVTNKGPDELIVREHDEGHTVALHTASHSYEYVYSSVENYFNDLYSVQERVKNLTGVEAKIIRFPGGSSNTISKRYSPGIMSVLTKEVLNRGFVYYDWNIVSGDSGETTEADVVYENVTSKLSKDRVNMVLMHDIKPHTRDALERIIKYGKENGYTFEAITQKTEMLTQRVNN